jgi:hypothetical protein
MRDLFSVHDGRYQAESANPSPSRFHVLERSVEFAIPQSVHRENPLLPPRHDHRLDFQAQFNFAVMVIRVNVNGRTPHSNADDTVIENRPAAGRKTVGEKERHLDLAGASSNQTVDIVFLKPISSSFRIAEMEFESSAISSCLFQNLDNGIRSASIIESRQSTRGSRQHSQGILESERIAEAARSSLHLAKG